MGVKLPASGIKVVHHVEPRAESVNVDVSGTKENVSWGKSHTFAKIFPTMVEETLRLNSISSGGDEVVEKRYDVSGEHQLAFELGIINLNVEG